MRGVLLARIALYGCLIAVAFVAWQVRSADGSDPAPSTTKTTGMSTIYGTSPGVRAGLATLDDEVGGLWLDLDEVCADGSGGRTRFWITGIDISSGLMRSRYDDGSLRADLEGVVSSDGGGAFGTVTTSLAGCSPRRAQWQVERPRPVE
jgi:hypothetical protein